MFDFESNSLPEWAVSELRRPVPTKPERQQRIMDMVRRAPAPRRRSIPAFHPRWFRRGVLSPSGAALAAGISAIMTLTGLPHASGRTSAFWAEASVIKDTVVTQRVGRRFVSALSDTMRIVRFALSAPGATRVALSGEFNAWSQNTTWLTRDEKTGMWVARLVVPRNVLRYAFVVDGDRWIGAPTPQAVGAGDRTVLQSI